MPGLVTFAAPFDGILFCPVDGNERLSDVTDPTLEATLRRRLVCLVGCVWVGSVFGVVLLTVAYKKS